MSLPKGYKRLEYIQSSGTQYINTGFIPNQNTRVVLDGYNDSASSGWTYGTWESATVNQFAGSCNKSYAVRYGTTNATLTENIPVGPVNFDQNKNAYNVNGTTGFFTAQTFSCQYSIFLFAINAAGAVSSGKFTGKIYSCQIYDNGTLVRDFIPCQNASGAIGLWDAANEVFYGNAGTGTFTAGPVVPEAVDESEITELEYIQSSGTQYFKTGFVPNQDARMKIKYQTDQTSAGGVAVVDSSWTSNAFGIWVNAAGYGASVYNNVVMYGDDPIEIDFNKNKLYKNGNLFWTGTESTFECPSDLTLMALNRNGAMQEYTTGKVFFCMLFDNGLLERDFVPAMLANGEVGLYDRVFHEFYRNAGTSEFIAGPEAQTVPKAPANFRVESESDTLVALAWDASDKALGYRLYRQGQLLADTEETSVAVTVEPFAGAIFTLTAYNENGEGKGTSLTYFKAPENPILFLLTDRTQADVTERNAKGYYAASDLNRVGYAVKYLAGRLRSSGVSVTVSPVLTWTDADWATPTTMKGYLADVQTMRGALKLASTTPEVPEDMERLTYTEANEIEAILLALDTHIKQMLMTVDAGWAMGLAYTGFYAKEAY